MKFPADSALLSHPLPSPPAFLRTPAPSAPKAATLVLPLFYQIQHLVLLQNFLPFSHLFDTPRLWQTLGSGECLDFVTFQCSLWITQEFDRAIEMHWWYLFTFIFYKAFSVPVLLLIKMQRPT